MALMDLADYHGVWVAAVLGDSQADFFQTMSAIGT